jgi:hypothetical protein
MITDRICRCDLGGYGWQSASQKTFDILAGIKTPNLALFIHTPSMVGIPALGQAPVSRKGSILGGR